jgi:ParB-like chromosome segregation protein Spo0J
VTTLKRHALSAAFPSLSEAEAKELQADIEAHGLRQPVVTYGGEVLDGWHRYVACMELGITPTSVEYSGDDPVAYVLSLNLSRRHLTASQRAAAVVACAQWQPAGRPEKVLPGSTFQTNETIFN